jgi:hypothetical protein
MQRRRLHAIADQFAPTARCWHGNGCNAYACDDESIMKHVANGLQEYPLLGS